jgi:hypothetical protein
LAGCNAQSQWQALAVDDHMQLAGQTAARASDRLVGAVGETRCMLVHPHH